MSAGHSTILAIPLYSLPAPGSLSVTQREDVLRSASSVTAPAAAQAADNARRRIALRLLPFLFILYVVNYLDRTSVAYGALGMSRDLGFSDRVLGLGAGVFFISYVALQIPGALLVEHWSARRLIAATMTTWGFLTGLTALVNSPGELYLVRFLLGAAEASFFPGVIVYLSHWFVRQDRAKASSRFMAAIPLSFVIGSPLAGWILGHRWLGVAGWRWLFILEGLPAVLLGAAAFFYLTDWPRQAAWLDADSRRWIERRLKEEKPTHKRPVTVWQAYGSGTVLLLAATAFFDYFVEYSFVFWFPTILKRQSALSDLRVGMLGSIPYAAAFAAMLIGGWHSDRTGERRWHAAVPQLIAAIALVGLLVLPRSTSLMVVLFTLVCLVFAFLPVFWTLPAELLSESAAAAAVGMINAVASIAGFAGPYVFGYLNTRTGTVSYGLAVMMVAGWAGAVLVLRAPGARPGRLVEETESPTA